MIGMHMAVQTEQLLQDGGAPEYMYHDLCCIHIFCPQKTHNAMLFYRGTRIQPPSCNGWFSCIDIN
jgi:hypothetical protein